MRPPRSEILMLAVSGDGHDIARAVNAGAAGYVLKVRTTDEPCSGH